MKNIRQSKDYLWCVNVASNGVRNRKAFKDLEEAKEYRDSLMLKKNLSLVGKQGLNLVTKVCSLCEEELPIGCFAKNRKAKSGLQSRCRGCHKKSRKVMTTKEKKKHREAARHGGLMRTYGISLDTYRDMLRDQGGVCKVCSTSDPGGRPSVHHNDLRFHVDHCHETGKIRGILCHNCNVGIGKLGDTTEALRRALKYLEDNS